MSPADEEAVRLGSLGPRRRPVVPETPSERGSPEGDLAPAFEDPGNRTIDDGIGEAPASQFGGDFQTAGAAAEEQVFGAPDGEVDVAHPTAGGELVERCRDDVGREAPRLEVSRDLGRGARRAGEIRDGGRQRVASVAGPDRRNRIRSGRS